jgi:hypothetical protein
MLWSWFTTTNWEYCIDGKIATGIAESGIDVPWARVGVPIMLNTPKKATAIARNMFPVMLAGL